MFARYFEPNKSKTEKMHFFCRQLDFDSHEAMAYGGGARTGGGSTMQTRTAAATPEALRQEGGIGGAGSLTPSLSSAFAQPDPQLGLQPKGVSGTPKKIGLEPVAKGKLPRPPPLNKHSKVMEKIAALSGRVRDPSNREANFNIFLSTKQPTVQSDQTRGIESTKQKYVENQVSASEDESDVVKTDYSNRIFSDDPGRMVRKFAVMRVLGMYIPEFELKNVNRRDVLNN